MSRVGGKRIFFRLSMNCMNLFSQSSAALAFVAALLPGPDAWAPPFLRKATAGGTHAVEACTRKAVDGRECKAGRLGAADIRDWLEV